MASLADQLKKVKLKPPSEPMKDFSSPKTAGFISPEEITNYQKSVLEVNTECWLEILQDETFPTVYCPLDFQDAQLFIKVYETAYKNADSEVISLTDWKKYLTNTDLVSISKMTEQLQDAMQVYVKEGGSAFVKTSSRSAKDAPLAQLKFKNLYSEFLKEYTLDDQKEENVQLICLMKAGFEAMKVTKAEEVIDMFFRSERIYQDMLLAVEHKESFCEHFVIRKFVHIDIDMEFRGFVFNSELSALSQYNYLIFSKKLVDQKNSLQSLILKYFNEKIKPKMVQADFLSSYIIDFAIVKDGEDKKVIVIEINPFLVTTDAALFSWEHELPLLEGKSGFEFRIVTKPKPGAKAMLPTSVRQLLKK